MILIDYEIINMMRICEAQPFLLTAEFERLKKKILTEHGAFIRYEKIKQRVRRMNSTGGGVVFSRSIFYKVYDLSGAEFRFQIPKMSVPMEAKIEDAEYPKRENWFGSDEVYSSFLALAELFDSKMLNRLLKHHFRCSEIYGKNEIAINEFIKKHQHHEMVAVT